MAIQTRPLGRTGTDVTVLGYGAMELRGRPHGPDVDDQEAGRLPDHIAMGVFGVFQIPYSAVQREHEDLITAGAGTLIRGGAARGAPAEDKNWRRGPIGLAEGEGKRRWDASGVDDLLGGMSRLEFVLRFTLSHPDLSSTIVGTSRVGHLHANLAIAEKGPLPADVYEQARRRLDPARA